MRSPRRWPPPTSCWLRRSNRFRTAARKAASERGARIGTLPGVTEDMLARVMSADMEGLRRKGARSPTRSPPRRRRGSRARTEATCGWGSRVERRSPTRGAERPGGIREPPVRRGFIAPVEGTCEGPLVDGSIAAVGIPDEPVTLTVAAGRLADATGLGARLMALLTEHGPEGDHGRRARDRIEREGRADRRARGREDPRHRPRRVRRLGGDQGTVQVPVHLDCVVMKPDVALDGAPVVRAGELLV